MHRAKTQALLELFQSTFDALKREFDAIDAFGGNGWIAVEGQRQDVDILVIFKNGGVSDEVQAIIKARLQAVKPGIRVFFHPD